MGKLYPKVLFFIRGTAPTKEQIEEADDYGPGVAFRNAVLIHPDGPIEEADGVAGDVPENYAAALPHIDDRDAVRARMMKRNPALATMDSSAVAKKETDEQRKARIDNALARGERPVPVNERNADPARPSERTTQSGHPRVTHTEPVAPGDGWGTNPETINAASDDGVGVGATDGDQGQPGATPVGAQGEGGPGQRAAPGGAPQGGAGNPRAKAAAAPARQVK